MRRAGLGGPGSRRGPRRSERESRHSHTMRIPVVLPRPQTGHVSSAAAHRPGRRGLRAGSREEGEAMAAVDVRFDEPEIRVAPPGPLARAVIAKDAAVMSPSCHREFPLVMERGEGVWVWDVDGNRFLDLFAGIAVSAAGHNHPAVVAAVQAQVEKFLHAGGADVYYPVLADLAEVYHAPFGDPDGVQQLLDHVVHPDDVAAIVVEPIQGEGGYRFSPDGFLPGLRSIADHHGILLIADEVQSGLGRTGRMWAVQHWGVTPDILVTSKGLAAGIPLGAVIAREEIMTWPPGSHGSTSAGNPVACAAAL